MRPQAPDFDAVTVMGAGLCMGRVSAFRSQPSFCILSYCRLIVFQTKVVGPPFFCTISRAVSSRQCIASVVTVIPSR